MQVRSPTLISLLFVSWVFGGCANPVAKRDVGLSRIAATDFSALTPPIDLSFHQDEVKQRPWIGPYVRDTE